MLKDYFKDIIKKFKRSKITTKIIVILLIMIELAMIFVSWKQTEYELSTPGFIGNPRSTIKIESNLENSNDSYIGTVSVVSFHDLSLVQYWCSKNNKEVTISKLNEKVLTNEAEKQYGIVAKRVSIINSIIYAYEKAKLIDPSINLVKSFKGLIVGVVLNPNSTDIVPDDIICEMQGEEIKSYDDFIVLLDKLLGSPVVKDGVSLGRSGGLLNENDNIKFKVKKYNDDTVTSKELKIFKNENGYLQTGLAVDEYYTLDGENSTPKFQVNYNELVDASGNSGGAMMTLSVYERLLGINITKGNLILGTGTINLDGTIGAIGAIEQKVVRAYLSKPKYFFVDDCYLNGDKTDYEMAVLKCQELGIDSSFIKPMRNFDDILKVLEELEDKDE